MLFHARRLRADLRGAKRWLLAITSSSLVISVVTTYMAAFALTDFHEGVLSPQPPAKPLSFLRVLDPDDSIARTVDSLADLNSRLKAPGLRVLLDHMGGDDRMFLVLPLDVMVVDPTVLQEAVTPDLAVIGRAPAFLRGTAPAGRGASLWGSIPGGVPGLSDSHIGPVSLHRVGYTPPSRSYVAGNGYRRETQGDALIRLSPADARRVGVDIRYSVSDVVGSFTCSCEVGDLAPLARAMTRAEQAAGSRRVYYALPYRGLIGPVEWSSAATGVLSVTFAAGTLLAVSGFAYLAVLLFWKRREHDYTVEQRAGAGEVALQVRQQVIVFAGVTLPVAVGFLLGDAEVRSTQPVPWPPFGGPMAPLAIVALHLAVGLTTAIAVHRLYGRPSRR